MVIHFSILAVIVVISFFCNNRAKNVRKIDVNSKMPLMPWLIIFGYLTFLAAMRSGMNDTSVYIYSFENYPGTVNDAINTIKEADIKYALTDALGNVFKAFISQEYHLWFLLFAAVESICFIYVYRRESYDIFFACFYFFASSLYYNYFSMMRQWMAVAICFGALELLKEKKWIKYLLCCGLGCLFHPSAVFCIAISFLALGKPWKKMQNLIFAASAVGILFLNPILSSMDDSESTYGYAVDKMTTNTGSSPIRIFIVAVPVILAFLYRKKIEEEDSFVLNFATNMIVFNCLLNVVATFTSGLYVIRLATYLSPYIAIVYSFLLTKGIGKENRRPIAMMFCALYFAYFCYQTEHTSSWGYSSDILGIFK